MSITSIDETFSKPLPSPLSHCDEERRDNPNAIPGGQKGVFTSYLYIYPTRYFINPLLVTNDCLYPGRMTKQLDKYVGKKSGRLLHRIITQCANIYLLINIRS